MSTRTSGASGAGAPGRASGERRSSHSRKSSGDSSRGGSAGGGRSTDPAAWLEVVRWNADGLVTAITQDAGSGRVLTLAWMNRDALAQTLATGEAHYWSRSRQKLWRKGEESGHVQRVRRVRLDCDADAILLSVDQAGGVACHTGRESCFYLELDSAGPVPVWNAVDPVRKDPGEIYGKRR